MINIVDGVKKYSKTDRYAVICDGEKLSYSQLDRYSDIIANYLSEKYDTHTPVAIYANKDIFILPCMIGALKSSRAYVPMDISFPQQRVKDVLESVKPQILFDFSGENFFYENDEPVCKDRKGYMGAEKNLREEFKDMEIVTREELVKFLEENRDSHLSAEVPKENWVKGDENSYILFTSGSTGKPKGVQISSYNLDSFIQWISPVLGLDGSEKVIMDQPAYSFDLSVSQLYPGIANGATLYSLSKKTVADFKKLFEEFRKSGMEIWVSTPTFAGMCLADKDFDQNMLPSLKKMLFIGEVLPVETARKLHERFPEADIINGYGPTEATVGISQVVITDKHINSGTSLPVGVPMPNCKIKIVDENGEDVKAGEKGEIVIIGPSVSKGYYRNDEKTKEAFYMETDGPDLFEDNGEELNGLRFRAYRTGDLGSILPDGNIKYSGRKDFQIKLNGYRIETEDIENNLRKVKNVKNAVVLPVYKNEKIAYLRAIVELEEKNSLGNLKNGIAIKKELATLIPEYMIPRNITVIDEMPTNTNGKIDRKKLAEI